MKAWEAQLDYPEDKTIHGLFEEIAAANPDVVAVVWGGEQLTYGGLNERANRVAHTIRHAYRLLHNTEMAPDTPIGIFISQGPNMVVGLLGILKAGGAYMPLDPAYPESRLRGMMEDAQTPLVLTEQALWEQLLFLGEHDDGIISLDGGWEQIAKKSPENPGAISGPRSLAYIIYTSGSTGKPKGVMVEHRSVINLVRNQNYVTITPSDCLGQAASISFDAATYEIWGALLNGARIALIHRDELLLSERLAAAQRKYGVTQMFFTTALLNLLAEGEAEGLLGLRVAIFGGEAANPAKVHNILNRKSEGLTLIHAYGPTECTTFSTCCNLASEYRTAQVLPIGLPLARMYAYVLNDQLQPVTDGTNGELYIGGDGVARGYLNRPELTAERFIQNPFVTEQQRALGKNLRLYKTGDVVQRLESGELIYQERSDYQIKIRGFRVELGEIEATLRAHPDVSDCVVTTIGESHQKRVVAYVIPVEKGKVDSQALNAYLVKTLPVYMIPSFFVEMEAFPLTLNGKIDRGALPVPLVLRRDTGEAPPEEKAGLPEPMGPRNDLERTVLDLVTSALNVRQMGIDENIFSYGAHSLIIAQICAAVRSRLRVALELKEAFAYPTVAGMARLISERSPVAADEDVAIPKAPRDQPIPLTYQQEQIWYLSKLAPDNRAYNSQFSVRFAGKLDRRILERCLNEQIRRHEILRTTFEEQNGSPVQVIHEPWEVSLPEVDLRGLPEERREEAAEQLIAKEVNLSFDYARLPLVKWRLYRLGDDDSILLHVEHHLIHDGWEVMVFLNELKALYTAFAEGRESPLADLPIQYADYAAWQKKRLSGQRLEEKVRYWIDKIRDYPHVLNLCTDHPRPQMQSFDGDMIRFDLDRDLYRSLREFSSRHDVTLFMTMYGAFAVLLSRYSGQDKFLIGTGVANRCMKETEVLMGMFVNAVLLYSDLSLNPSFSEFLKRTGQNILEDAPQHDTPFPAIVKGLRAGNKPGLNPVFQVIFAFHDSAVPILDFAGIRGTITERHNKTAKTDMNVICIPRAEQHVTLERSAPVDEDLTVIWEYNSDIFERGTIEQMIRHYITLLRQIIMDPGLRVRDLTMVSEGEAVELLALSAGERVDYPREKTLHELFEEQVRRHPRQAAVVHNGQVLSYLELSERSEGLAWQLRQVYQEKAGAPLGPGMHVGLCVGRGLDMIVGTLAILKAGGAYVPVPPEYPEKRLRFILDDADIKVVLSQKAVKDSVPWLWEGGWTVIAIDAPEDSATNRLRDQLPTISSSSDAAYVLYTSGSTGTPKGVAIPHRAVHNFVMSAPMLHYSESDVVAQISNHAFDAATFEIWGSLGTGAKLVVIDSKDVLNPDRLWEIMEKNGVTASFFTTSLFNLLAESKIEVLTRLKCIHFGGEMANPHFVRNVISCKGEGTALINVYGPTECTTYSAVCELTGKYAQSDVIPIGRPLRNYMTYVLDEQLRPVPIGVPGEIYIGGDSVAIGYLHRPELTEHKFIPNPFATVEDRGRGVNLRLYRTGDMARWLPDGTLHFLGRTDFQVKIRGYRIEPEEVERVLIKHPGVSQCVVIPWEGHLVAYWVPPDPPGTVTQSDLRSFLATQLPEYMVPAGFIAMDRFELNWNAKIDRTKLPPPSLGLLSREVREYVAPRNRTEEALAVLWQEILHSGKVGIHDSFFDLGGNSLLTVRMLGRVKQELGADINLASLFSMPTIAALASLIDQSAPVDAGDEDNVALALEDAEIDIPLGNNTAEVRADGPERILLTGATGFLGIHLLEQLLSLTRASIYCLVRGTDQETVRTKFRDKLHFYGRPDLEESSRIILLQGDMREPALGLPGETVDELSDIIDHVWHCGAFVHHIFDYRTLRGENVQSTVELLKIAANGRPKVFNFVSTLSVASRRDGQGKTVEVDLGDRPISSNGYILTKWASERILLRQAAKGLPVNIFRPGNITGHSETGICPPEKNHALLLMKGCIQMQCAPDWQRGIEMTPVDTLAAAMVQLSLHSRGANTFNMNNPREMGWGDYIAALGKLGFRIEMVPVAEWQKRLEMVDETNALFPLREFYLKERKDLIDPESHAPVAQDSSKTQETLRQLEVSYLQDYTSYIPTLIGYLKNTGFLPGGKEREHGEAEA